MWYAVIRTRNRQVLALRLDTDALQYGVDTEFGKKTVKHTPVAPHQPCSNSQAQRFVQAFEHFCGVSAVAW